MPTFDSDGVRIFYQSTGDGFPLIWSHEFAGSYESWEQQVRYFSHRYRVITYNDRGYPPSEVPMDPEAYSQDITIEDLRRLMDHLSLEQAYIGGLSMGGNVALNFALRYPERCKAIIVASAGSGTTHNEAFRSGGEAMAARLLAEGTPPVMKDYGSGPTRVQLQRKDPRGYEEFMRLLFGHNARGSAYTFRGVQLRRPTVDQLVPQMNRLQVPTSDNDRRRGRPVRGAVYHDETGNSPQRTGSPAPMRPRHQPGGAGTFQPPGVGLPGIRGGWQVGRSSVGRHALLDRVALNGSVSRWAAPAARLVRAATVRRVVVAKVRD